MKSMKLFLAASLVLVSISCFGFDRDKVVTFSNLPKESQKFIKTHFPNVKVSRVVKDIDSFTHSWEVDFVNGWEIEFTGAGKWDHIDCKGSAVPASVLALLPANILTYCKAHFPNAVIVEIDHETYGYEVELLGDITIEFDKKGNFIRIDD